MWNVSTACSLKYNLNDWLSMPKGTMVNGIITDENGRVAFGKEWYLKNQDQKEIEVFSFPESALKLYSEDNLYYNRHKAKSGNIMLYKKDNITASFAGRYCNIPLLFSEIYNDFATKGLEKYLVKIKVGYPVGIYTGVFARDFEEASVTLINMIDNNGNNVWM